MDAPTICLVAVGLACLGRAVTTLPPRQTHMQKVLMSSRLKGLTGNALFSLLVAT